MASTTTNYGFDVPTSSDLVKNGATQIALLGQDLDTFLFRPFTRNAVINSGFNVWQRGTSGTANSFAAGAGYNADRWQNYYAGTLTVSRQATGDTTNLPFIQYCARVQRNSGQTNTTASTFGQSIETVNSIPFAGKTVTLSYYARAGANYSATSNAMGVVVDAGTGTDQNVFFGFTGATRILNATSTLTTTWQRFSHTFSVASTYTQLGLLFIETPTGTAGANDYFEVTGVMLEVGSQASPYAPATPTYATELAACQRYCYKATNDATDKTIASGGYYASTVFLGAINFPVTMRTAPTATIVNAASYWALYANSAVDYGDTLAMTRATLNSCNLELGGNVSGTAGHAAQLATANAAASLILSAELQE